MRNTTRKCLALFLAVLQLAVLFPLTAFAENADQSNSETPVLNELKVGTVQFQSFNFLGDNATGSDGVDYTSTFYYTDDFFSPSAIHETNSTSLKWSELTPNELSLASTSFDLAVAAYASNENNVLTATDRTWDNTYYPGKDKNAKAMLETCGFTNFESYSTYDQAPTNDSIAYVIASKPITVWDETSQSNKDFTLIAVAVRGAGYGAEWASNVTIGNKNTNQLPANGRHWGFDDAAVTICTGIRSYLSAHNITSDAKYWITGFSRAGAAANLVAGYVTDGAESTYHTHQRDVYGFTWECPKGAAKSENALNYKNIHNIINAMDAVPKVSPDAFQHQRLGVDYVMPYYDNTTTSENETYYTQMREVLKTIAVGAYNYGGESYQADPLIEYTDPANYPYNRTMTVYTITATRLIGDAIDGDLMNNFGTVEATGSNKKLTAKYIDKFIDDLINVFLVSGAWNGKIGASNTTTALSNRTKFISDYQAHFRNVLGYLLDYSGPAFLGMVDALIDAVGEQLSLSNTVTNAGLGLAFLNFYEYPTSTYKWGVPPFIDPWVGSPSWAGQTRRAVLISEAQPVVKNVIRNMVGSFVDPQGITRSQFETSMDKLVELVVNLYADELSRYNSNYFGTTLHYMWQILCTHEQEVVMSWIKSLDPNHMNRSARTITIPAGCDATLYEYRPEIEGNLDDALDTDAPVVAEVKNRALVAETLKDQRIYCTTSNGNVVIRYPASLQIRADIKASDNLNLSSVQVADYQTTNAYVNLSNGKSQFETTTLNSANGYKSITGASATNVTAANTALRNYGVTLKAGDVLHILADDIATFNANNTGTYTLSIDRTESEVTEYAVPSPGLTTGTDTSKAVSLDGKSTVTTTDTSKSIRTRLTKITIPASCVYFDDDFNQPVSGKAFGDSVYSVGAEPLEGGQQLWFKFTGTRIDVYCTTDSNTGYIQAAVYEADENGEATDTRVGLKTMKSASDTTRYNVPTISFDGLKAGQTYYLKLTILNASNYKLDGVRVYNSGAASGADAVTFANLRELLLGESEVAGITDQTDGAAFYVDHAEEGESHVMALTAEDYANVSPKNELYLYNGQSVAFQINGSYDSVAVGLSAPENNGSGTVTVTNGSGTKQETIGSVVDTYVTINPSDSGYVSIHNDTNVLIAVTNVRVEGFVPAEAGRSALAVSSGLKSYARSFLSLVPPVIDEPEETPAVEEPEETAAPTPTPEPTPTPTPVPTPAPTPTPTPSPVSSFINAVFRSIGRLFGF